MRTFPSVRCQTTQHSQLLSKTMLLIIRLFYLLHSMRSNSCGRVPLVLVPLSVRVDNPCVHNSKFDGIMSHLLLPMVACQQCWCNSATPTSACAINRNPIAEMCRKRGELAEWLSCLSKPCTPHPLSHSEHTLDRTATGDGHMQQHARLCL
jgi:hypothetical protein